MWFTNRVFIFGVLAILAVACAVVGRVTRRRVLDDALKQGFWLIVGVLLTSFVIESLVSLNLDARRREQDTFAFQTFTGAMLDQLTTIVGVPPEAATSVMVSATDSPASFAHSAQAAAQRVRAGRAVDPDAYLVNYLDIGSGLRDLAINHIGIFTSSRRDMVQTYGRLNELASRWRYLDELSSGYRQATDSRSDSDPEKARRKRETAKASAVALQAATETAAYLAEVAARATTPNPSA
jgi:hypothetical protein